MKNRKEFVKAVENADEIETGTFHASSTLDTYLTYYNEDPDKEVVWADFNSYDFDHLKYGSGRLVTFMFAFD